METFRDGVLDFNAFEDDTLVVFVVLFVDKVPNVAIFLEPLLADTESWLGKTLMRERMSHGNIENFFFFFNYFLIL